METKGTNLCILKCLQLSPAGIQNHKILGLKGQKKNVSLNSKSGSVKVSPSNKGPEERKYYRFSLGPIFKQLLFEKNFF